MPNKNYNGRRVNEKCYFEPIFDPELAESIKETDFKNSDWDFDNDKGPCRYIFLGEALLDKRGLYPKIDGITFTECDFVGKFEAGAIVFSNCTFDKCEFRGELHNVKFSNCEFKDTSLSLLKLNNCQFRDCGYKRLGLSGNETQIFSTDITHPGRFLAAATTNLEHLPRGVTREYQLLRLQITRATLARVILQNQAAEGTDDSYYDAVKAATLYSAKSRKASAKLRFPKFDSPEKAKDRNTASKIFSYIGNWAIAASSDAEYAILWLSGVLNGWGRSVFRVFCVGVLFIVALSLLRSCVLGIAKYDAFAQSLEIFLLFGYTKYSLAGAQFINQSVDIATAIFGLCWFAISAATIVNKVTRVRG